MATEPTVLDVEMLITEVQKRPGLYDPTLPSYMDKGLKKLLWEEVAEALCDRWMEHSRKKKEGRLKDIQRRWRSLRDSFRRDLQVHKTKRKGSSAFSKKRYIYSEQLMFLKPTMEYRQTGSNLSKKSGDVEIENEQEVSIESESSINEVAAEASCSEQRLKKSKLTTTATPLEDQLFAAINCFKQNTMEDEDLLFAKSLMCTLKQMTLNTRMLCKAEMLNVCRKFLVEVDQGTLPSTSSDPQMYRQTNYAPMYPGMPQYGRPQTPNSPLDYQTLQHTQTHSTSYPQMQAFCHEYSQNEHPPASYQPEPYQPAPYPPAIIPPRHQPAAHPPAEQNRNVLSTPPIITPIKVEQNSPDSSENSN